MSRETKSMNNAPALIRMRELPQIQTLERRLLLYGDDPNHVETLIEEASLELFGMRPSDPVYREHETKYLASQQPTDDMMMGVLLGLMGLDFSDERGQPLRCTKHLARAAEAAAMGIAGRLPDGKAAELEKFEDGLTRDREAFLAKKRRAPR
jgi:hypothetical protein